VAGRTARRRVLKVTISSEGDTQAKTTDTQAEERADLLAAEEPLGIRVGGEALTVTMRTPGDDIELTAGFLVSESIVTRKEDVREIRLCDGASCRHDHHEDHEVGNITDVTLTTAATAVADGKRRSFMTTSACGVCGKASIEELAVASRYDLAADQVRVPAEVLAGLPDALRAAQRVFEQTGGLHAAGLFTAEGRLLASREDVGRHNAVDKIVGWALRSGRLPLAGCVLLVSGRASFELVQKAVLAGIPVLAAVSAPSSLAADLAQQSGLTLVGFLRGSSMNVYTGQDRILAD
jgi:FdhD protein